SVGGSSAAGMWAGPRATAAMVAAQKAARSAIARAVRPSRVTTGSIRLSGEGRACNGMVCDSLVGVCRVFSHPMHIFLYTLGRKGGVGEFRKKFTGEVVARIVAGPEQSDSLSGRSPRSVFAGPLGVVWVGRELREYPRQDSTL